MMPDQERAGRLGKEAFDLWQAGKLDDAVPVYREALAVADPTHWATPGLHGEYAAVLSSLGRKDDATAEYEHAIAGLIAQGPEGGQELVVTTYFLAEHLVRFGNFEGAMSAIAKSRSVIEWKDWLLGSVEAEALWALGRHDEAKQVAQRALEGAPTPEAKANVRDVVGHILDSTEA